MIYKSRLVILCITLLFGVVILFVEPFRFGDFQVFLEASKALYSHQNIYANSYIDGFHYFYSPLFATILLGFHNAPDIVPLIIWKLLNLFFLYRVWIMFENLFLDLTLFSPRQKILFQLLVFASGFFLLFSTFHLSQMTLFLLYGLLEGVYQIRQQKNLVFGSILIALVINIKIMPVVIIPWLLYRGEFKSTIYVVLFIILLLFLPGLILGFQYNSFLLSEWWKSINPSNIEHVLDLEETGFHGLSSFIAALCSSGVGNNFDLPLKRNVVSLEPETISSIINFFRLVLISLTLLVLKSKPFTRAIDKPQLFRELSYIFLITPLIFPHQQVYGFLFAFPAIVYVIYFLVLEHMAIGIKAWRLILVIISMVVINLELFLGFARAWLWHYKTLTYGVLLLLVVLILFAASELRKNTSKIRAIS